MSDEGMQGGQASLELPLGSREELEKALDTRVRPTAEDAERIGSLSGLDLRQAVYRASDALSVFDDLLLQLQDDDFRLDEALETVEANALTDEHDWRRILQALAEAGDDADELRAVGLVKYRRYLRNRLEALETRQSGTAAGGAGTQAAPAADATQVADPGLDLEFDYDAGLDLELELDADEAPPAPPTPSPADSAPLELDDLHAPGREAEEEGPPASPTPAADGRPTRLMRLHRGKPVALVVGDRREAELWLGKSRFRLAFGGNAVRLLSDRGECGRLREGRNLVGRSPDCEIVIDPRHDTVSRMHLEVAVEGGRLVSVTDLSSGGTYVRPELVPRRTDAA